jgi:glycosyltransferase involved in cell wall biosynthesis
LAALADLDVYVDAAPHARAAMLEAVATGEHSARPLAALHRVEALQGPYDRVIYALGNSEHHTGALAGLRRRRGIVLAHDIRLTNLYRFAQWQHPDAVPDGFHRALHRLYPERLPAALGDHGSIDEDAAERWGVVLAREAITLSDRFVATSSFAADMARLDAFVSDRHKIVSGGFAFGPAWPETERLRPGADAQRRFVVASFGLIHPVKQPDLIVDAFAWLAARRPDIQLVFVGPAAPDQLDALRAQAARLGIGERVTITGAVDRATYRGWLRATTLAVQLRAATNGESSAATGDCIAAGRATVVTHIGSARDIPSNVAVPVTPYITSPDLAEVLRSLLDDPPQVAALESAAVAYADQHTFTSAAADLYELASSLPGDAISARALN